VLFNEKKYACETCIKGHRSSGCKHTDRALYEIKKKGRPVTQCEQCRELRKTKQVHVKCICPKGEGSGQASNSNLKGILRSKPAFPNGLPQASIAVQHLSEGSSDSEYGTVVSLSQSRFLLTLRDV
ncbi:transcription factor, partial [Lentinula aff. lateritia]